MLVAVFMAVAECQQTVTRQHSATSGLGLVEEVRPGTKGAEVVRGTGAPTTERFAVTELLQVAQPAGNATVAVGVERIEGQAHPPVAVRVHLCRGQDRLRSASTISGGWIELALTKKDPL